MSNKQSVLPYLAGVCFSVLFGLSFIFSKEGLEVLDPFHLLTFRFAAAVFLLNVLRYFKLIRVELKNKRMKTLLSLSLFQPVIYFICEMIGLNKTTASEAGMMIALIPVASVILAVLVLKERPTRIQLFFVICSVFGVFFIMAMAGSVDVGDNFQGMVILLGAVFAASTYNILARKSSLHFSSIEITYVMMTVGLIVFSSISIFQHLIYGNITMFFQPLFQPQAIISILYLGFLSSVIGFFMMNYMLSKVEATKASVFSNLITVVSISAGVIILNDPFYWYHIIGGILIIVGVWGTNYFSRPQPSLLKKTVTS
ncbi:MAG: DMT family transporter [Tindallia sp. MSAO_Bac2]|nr:MAG: DMT family transporter [Tindallia sp. MSAO_Bac2]